MGGQVVEKIVAGHMVGQNVVKARGGRSSKGADMRRALRGRQ